MKQQLERCPPVCSLINCQSFPLLTSTDCGITSLSGRSGVHWCGVLSFQHQPSQEQRAFYCSTPHPNPVACTRLMKTGLCHWLLNLEFGTSQESHTGRRGEEETLVPTKGGICLPGRDTVWQLFTPPKTPQTMTVVKGRTTPSPKWLSYAYLLLVYLNLNIPVKMDLGVTRLLCFSSQSDCVE